METKAEEKVLIDNVIAPAFIKALQTAGLYAQFMRNLAYGSDPVLPARHRNWDRYKHSVRPYGYVWSAFTWDETPEGHETWKTLTMYWERDVLDEIM